ncbi:MAG TPA: methyltransferase domain-containing protein, partial [Terriglobales bacterium]|nr:methyltransferase domain-containing protein [Terriglobales bacterium]
MLQTSESTEQPSGEPLPAAQPAAAPAASGSAPCPLCGAGGERMFSRHGYGINRCSACSHHYAEVEPDRDHVARHYGDEYFFGGGAGFPDYNLEAEPLREHGRHYARLIAKHRRSGRVLDVGAAAGFLLEGFLEQGWTGAAIEPNQTMATQLTRRLGCPVHTGALETFAAEAPFDLVLMIQVIPHFVDMGAALQAAAAATAPDGMWLIETWDRGSTTARIF